MSTGTDALVSQQETGKIAASINPCSGRLSLGAVTKRAAAKLFRRISAPKKAVAPRYLWRADGAACPCAQGFWRSKGALLGSRRNIIGVTGSRSADQPDSP